MFYLHDVGSTLSCEVYMKKLLRWLSILPALLFPLVIFGFSAQTGSESGSLSYSLCQIILKFFDRLFSLDFTVWEINSYAMSIHILIRKIAHVTEYFLLSFCVFLPFRVWFYKPEAPNPRKELILKAIIPSFLISLCYASIDELFQSFVPGRHGSPVDVLIDSIGITLGCALLIFCYFQKTKHADKC